jgi:mRNA interferase RelE/StbE
VAYEILFRPRVERDFKRVPPHIRDRLLLEISSLAEDPRPAGAVKLTGSDNLYRVRVGDYRVIYAIEDDFLVVLVVEVGHRREIYGKPDKKLTRQFLREFIKNKIQ